MSEVGTLTLAEFLLARIAEDEAAATGASHHGHLVHDYERDNYGFLWVKTTRVLAECEAKRRIVEEHRGGKWPHPGDPCDAHDASGRTVPCDTLRFLALPYADHPEYCEEFKP